MELLCQWSYMKPNLLHLCYCMSALHDFSAVINIENLKLKTVVSERRYKMHQSLQCLYMHYRCEIHISINCQHDAC